MKFYKGRRITVACHLSLLFIDSTTTSALNLCMTQMNKRRHGDVPILNKTMKKQKNSVSKKRQVNRRNALVTASSTIFGMSGYPIKSNAELIEPEAIDLDAIKAAQSKTATLSMPGMMKSSGNSLSIGFIPMKDPPPTLTIRGGIEGKSTIKIPRVGYSLYKTAPDVAARCTAIALRSGVRHFDVGTLYGSNDEISIPIKNYLDNGMDAIDSITKNEKPELNLFLDETKNDGNKHALTTISSGLITNAAPAPSGSAGRRGRREGLFISHKLSNKEQSMKRIDVRRAVKAQIAALGTQYLDLVSIHSPLTDKGRRLESYAALLELRDQGFVKSVGVCNYGLGALEELRDYGLDLPSINQLELSPFNTHPNILNWCKDNNIAVGCGAWSKLSSADGPQEQWAVLGEIASKKGMTKAQVLVRWSLQKGFVCVPRSAAGSKLERYAIAENSYGGINRREGQSCMLTDEELEIIDSLNVDLKAGKLGRRDGWDDADVMGIEWDPTDFV